MARRYFVCPLPQPGPFSLPREIAHHVGRVLRGSPGETVVLFDGDGQEVRTEILEAGKQKVQVLVSEHYTSNREPATRLAVAFALPRGQRADQIFEHGTELGIASFHPLWTERSERRTRCSTSRWGRIVRAACGQCDRARLPKIHAPEDLDTFLARDDLAAERYVATQGGAPLGAATSPVALLLIGPEGGLSGAELDQLAARDFASRSLGPLTLRTETAVLVSGARLLQ